MQEQDLPIDIHTNKLLDWLISRRHCNREWQEKVRIIREKINNAIQDMPAVDEIAKLLSGSYVNYFHCVKIVELLKDTESATKNIFGRYSSQRMKDWQEVVRLYETDNVCLAECAQMLIRNVNYEIPSLKKQISKCQQIQEESDRKETDLIRNANELKDKYYSECKQLGIEGINIKSELIALLSELPDSYSKVAESTKALEDACQYYTVFMEFTLGKKVDYVLPLTKYIIQRGNTTTYEWRTGEKPSSVEEQSLQVWLDEDASNEKHDSVDVIDFGADDEINFDVDDVGNSNDVIDFGADEPKSDTHEIDWDATKDINNDGATDGIAKGEDALMLLDNPKVRNLFIDELSQLDAFLDQRCQEMHGEGDFLSSNRFQTAPPLLQLQTAAQTSAMVSQVRKIVQLLTNVKMLNLQLIRSSHRYVDRVVESLKQKLLAADKMLSCKDAVIVKREQALEEQRMLEPRLDLIIVRTRELQKQIEAEISKRYKNRPVNIMGGVNTL